MCFPGDANPNIPVQLHSCWQLLTLCTNIIICTMFSYWLPAMYVYELGDCLSLGHFGTTFQWLPNNITITQWFQCISLRAMTRSMTLTGHVRQACTDQYSWIFKSRLTQEAGIPSKECSLYRSLMSSNYTLEGDALLLDLNFPMCSSIQWVYTCHSVCTRMFELQKHMHDIQHRCSGVHTGLLCMHFVLSATFICWSYL